MAEPTPLPTRNLTLPRGRTATITASYALSASPINPAKPTLVCFNSFTTDASLFSPQFDALAGQMNLVAVELLGHGGSKMDGPPGTRDNWTYWDSAWMALEVVRELGVEKCFVAGTSQGGWVAVRTALLAPEMVLGVIPMGTSMDAETPRTVALGCWDGRAAAAGPIAMCTSTTPTPDFAPPDAYCDFLIDSGLGKDCAPAARAYWTARLKHNYPGDDGRRRMRACAVNLADRDGLHGRLPDVRCPVLWLHGDRDEVYSVANAEEEIRLFSGSKEARMEVVEGGFHFLSASSADVVNPKIAAFVERFWKGA